MASKPKAKTKKNANRKAHLKAQQRRDEALAEGRRVNKINKQRFKNKKAEGEKFPEAIKREERAKQKAALQNGHCGAKKRDGKPCKRSAGWGTDHPGHGSCKHHSGSTYPGQVAAAASAIGLTRALPITPAQGLLGVLHLAAGQLAYVNERVAEVAEGDMFLAREVDPVTSVAKMVPHYWIEFQRAIMRDVARYSKLAADVGIAERAQSLREQQTRMVQNLIEAVCGDLELTPEQRAQVGPSIRKNLLLIQGGQGQGTQDGEPSKVGSVT